MHTRPTLRNLKIEITANPLFWLNLQIPSPHTRPSGAIVLVHPVEAEVDELAKCLQSTPVVTPLASLECHRVPPPHAYLRVIITLTGTGEVWDEALAAATAITTALLKRNHDCT